MNEWLNLSDGGWWYVAGWTMLHFLWLGTLVALAAGACRLVLRRASANVRYAAALASLVVLAALPIGIATWEAAKPQAMGTTESLVDPPPIQATPTAPGSAGGLTGAVDMKKLSAITPLASNEQPFVPDTAANPRQSRGLTDVLSNVAGYLPWAWLTGTPLTFVLLVTGVVGAERLRRSSRIITDGPIADTCAQLVDSLRIGRRVTVAICDRIAAPVLVGIVRPMILLPSSALTGWSPDEIEMVLLHELAHVRRWDNLVNLAQRFIEAALFFHPAVWLVSRWVRAEREACCDNVVVGRTNRPHAYAELLVALAAQLPRSVLFHPAATSAMAAGPLRGRIRRILGLQDDPMLISGKSLGVVMGSLLVVATLLMFYLPGETTAEEPNPTAAKKVAGKGGVDEPAHRVEVMNHLKDLALALFMHHDAKGALPAAASFDADGHPLLSWRVHILPYLDGNAAGEGTAAELYKEFHLDEPWDSDHNRKLVPRMPAVFRNSHSASDKGGGFTNLLGVVGNDCVFDGSSQGIKFSEISDGASNTIMLVEADEAVEWTKPADFRFNPAFPKAGLGGQHPNGWIAAFADGSVRMVNKHEPDEKVLEMFTCGRKADPLDLPPSGNTSMASSATFPTLEDQKLADAAYKRLGLELEAIGEEDLKRVRALGYDGGVLVTQNNGTLFSIEPRRGIAEKDIIVGLHIWPTRSVADVLTVLDRDDLVELNPLKYYLVRLDSESGGGFGMEGPKLKDIVVTGRISVRTDQSPRKSTQSTPGKVTQRDSALFAYEPVPIPPLSESEKKSLLERGPLRIQFYFSKNSEPCRRADEMVSQYATAFPNLITVERIDVEEQPALVASHNIRVAPTLLLFHGEQPIDQISGVWSVPELESLITQQGRRLVSEPKPQPNLRYDGRTFREWKMEFGNRGPREAEALTALEAFVVAGYGPEAANTILSGVFSPTATIAKRSRKFLSTLPVSEAEPIVARLVEVLETDLATNRRIDAIRAIAAIGPPANSALGALKQRLPSSEPQECIAAAAAIKMIVGKDQYQKPVADVLGKELGIRVIETNGVWAALPREDATDDGKAFSDFTDAVIKEQQQLFPDGKF